MRSTPHTRGPRNDNCPENNSFRQVRSTAGSLHPQAHDGRCCCGDAIATCGRCHNPQTATQQVESFLFVYSQSDKTSDTPRRRPMAQRIQTRADALPAKPNDALSNDKQLPTAQAFENVCLWLLTGKQSSDMTSCLLPGLVSTA